MTPRISRRTLASGVGIVVLAITSSAIAQGSTAGSVYRCKQANGSIAYQDYPCKGGVAVEIKPDAADPAAIQRLRRGQADFDRALAQRRAAEERAAILGEQLQGRRALESSQGTGYEDEGPSDVPEYLLYGPIPRTSLDRRHRRSVRRFVVPEHRIPAVIRRPWAS